MAGTIRLMKQKSAYRKREGRHDKAYETEKCLQKKEKVGTIKLMKQKSAYRKRESRHDKACETKKCLQKKEEVGTKPYE